MNQLLERIEASLRQSLRVSVSQGEMAPDLDTSARAALAVAFVLGRWHRFAKSGFRKQADRRSRNSAHHADRGANLTARLASEWALAQPGPHTGHAGSRSTRNVRHCMVSASMIISCPLSVRPCRRPVLGPRPPARIRRFHQRGKTRQGSNTVRPALRWNCGNRHA